MVAVNFSRDLTRHLPRLCCAALGFTALAAALPPAWPPRAAELFAEGTISTADDEVGITFTPDGRTAYFGKVSRTTTTTPISVICVAHRDQGRWSEPEVAPFSGRWHDLYPALSPDGTHLFFTSDRPVPGRPASKDLDVQDLHLWVVTRAESGWGEPRPLGPPIESPGAHEQAAAIAGDGTLYFSSDRPEGKGRFHLYRARWAAGHYAPAENLVALNGPAWDSQPAIAPDQGTLVFASVARPDVVRGGGAHYYRSDLYASFRTAGGWSAPRHLGPAINSAADEWCPSFSPDGKWLFFTSERGFATVPLPRRLTAAELEAGLKSTLNGAGNIYRIDAGAVREVALNGQEAAHARR